MSFKIDYSKISDTNVQDGDYEVLISKVEEGANPNTGSEYVNFDMVIRNDIADQKFQNAHVFYRVYRNKQTGEYPDSMIFQVAKAAGMNDGKQYNSFEEFMNDMAGKPLKVRVKNETSDYKGKTYENLNVKRWGITHYPDVQHQWPTDMQPQSATKNTDDAITIDDEEMPF
ncbi:DUF669 domain-containing protein [Lentilactobacillus sp. Marseille-Q4993]|uniref:DUF669 domain-containing protein n=1 Tax=Lentilactobacillus sp. Marseille-Q4993 TaxID=3039492 RepID=UPI0024BD376B|nr:DUF669 domain-containing protein [Lentilactobacillus sp. Marseille-Q4993]